jgi:hypothetical protein
MGCYAMPSGSRAGEWLALYILRPLLLPYILINQSNNLSVKVKEPKR